MSEISYNGKTYYDPVELTMEQLGGPWKMPILWRLQTRTFRYSELKKEIPHISDKTLTIQLRELERDGYLHRMVFAVVPPRTEYSLTELGKTAIPIIEVLRNYSLNVISKH